MITKQQVSAAVRITAAVAEAIRELREVPSGHLYAHVMGSMSYDTYEQVIDTLVRAELVRRSPGHLLTWVGPNV